MTKTKSKTIQQQKQQFSKESKHPKDKLPLQIDLNIIHNPNPAIKTAYVNSGASDQFYPFQQTSEFLNEKRIFTYAAKTKNNPEGQKISHKIVSLYRIRKDDKEYCYFYEHLLVRDRLENTYD
ncbi:MAG: hypothetical protein H0W89_08255 [Candidatus Levybacteria bacterium]|nr:hypothetical protein [Candidatus Levybacteria bacterium]